MQQPELFTVALILWGGIFIFLLYLAMKVLRVQKGIDRLVVTQDEE